MKDTKKILTANILITVIGFYLAISSNLISANNTNSSSGEKVASNNKLGTYEGYLDGKLFIVTKNTSQDLSLKNCKLKNTNNPKSSIKCIWNGKEIYSFTPSVNSNFSKGIILKNSKQKAYDNLYKSIKNNTKISFLLNSKTNGTLNSTGSIVLSYSIKKDLNYLKNDIKNTKVSLAIFNSKIKRINLKIEKFLYEINKKSELKIYKESLYNSLYSEVSNYLPLISKEIEEAKSLISNPNLGNKEIFDKAFNEVKNKIYEKIKTLKNFKELENYKQETYNSLYSEVSNYLPLISKEMEEAKSLISNPNLGNKEIFDKAFNEVKNKIYEKIKTIKNFKELENYKQETYNSLYNKLGNNLQLVSKEITELKSFISNDNINKDFFDKKVNEIYTKIESNSKNTNTILNEIDEIINSQTLYITSLQTPEGALKIGNDALDGSNTINPYFSNIAAMSLLKADPVKYKKNVEKYIEWYFNNINWPDMDNLNGTIYDYKYSNKEGKYTSINNYDSADSYSATFLSLLKTYHETTKSDDLFKKKDRKYHIDIIAGTMVILQDPNTLLTNAKKSYPIQYLMDNTEVYKGFLDAGYIFSNIYNDKEVGSYFNIKSQDIKKSIQLNLYNSSSKKYYPRYKYNEPDLKKLYPDGQSQLFPILFKTQDKLDCSHYDTFNKNFPEWINGKHNDTNRFPDSFVAQVAFECGDFKSLKTFLKNVKKEFINKGNNWPWNINEAAWVLNVSIDCKKSEKCLYDDKGY